MQRGIPHRALLLLTALAPLVLAGAAGRKEAGTVILSNREKIVGEISLTRGQPLLVRAPDRKAPLRVQLSEAARIDVAVVRERAEKEWRFKEEGSSEKVYTGRTRPRLEFGLKIALRNGEVLKGEIAKGTTLFVDAADGGRRKTWLQPYVCGEYGQTPKDVVYVKSVVLGEAAPETPAGDAGEEAPTMPAPPADPVKQAPETPAPERE